MRVRAHKDRWYLASNPKQTLDMVNMLTHKCDWTGLIPKNKKKNSNDSSLDKMWKRLINKKEVERPKGP